MPPPIFGIVNITADSFSDGGNYLAPQAAISHARKLLADGADVLDVGAAASNPDAQTVPWAEEIKRLSPMVEAITDRTKLSIDTFSIATQRWALTQGIGWLNDIQGFPDPSLYGELAASNARLVVMHNVAVRGRAERIATDPDTIFDRLFRFFDDRLNALEAAGIKRDRLVIDPGMGFFLGTIQTQEISPMLRMGNGRRRLDPDTSGHRKVTICRANDRRRGRCRTAGMAELNAACVIVRVS